MGTPKIDSFLGTVLIRSSLTVPELGVSPCPTDLSHPGLPPREAAQPLFLVSLHVFLPGLQELFRK